MTRPDTNAFDDVGSARDLVHELGKLAYLSEGGADRLLGVAMALAGELFVLKAKHERLVCALECGGVLGEAALEEAGRHPKLQAWLTAEEKSFAKEILDPFLAPDLAVNSTSFMRAS